MSSNVENEYFSDGITEEIINALAKIQGLKITSRTSSFYFKGKNIPIKDIGSQLQVSTILEGSVRVADSTIRITAQLIDSEEDFHFWSETWDRKLENIFKIQDEISLLIADKLREQLGHFEIQEQLVAKQTNNYKAYEFYLKAKYLKNKWSLEDTQQAISLFEKVVALDSNHGQSYAGLADCYSFLGTTGFIPYEEAWGKSHQYTQQALVLDDQLSEVHYQLSNEAFFIECDYQKSLSKMKRAIVLNPSNAEAQQFISFLYIVAGNQSKAKEHLDISASLNPLSEETQFFKAYFHYMMEDFETALALLDKCLIANNKNIPAHSVKGICLVQMQRYDEAIAYFDAVPKEIVILGEKIGIIGLAHAFKKDQANSHQYLGMLEEQTKKPNGFTADSYLFMMQVALGQFDKAFTWVEDAIQNKKSLLLLRYLDPLVHVLKSDTRYEKYRQIIFAKDIKIEVEPKNKKGLLDIEKAKAYTDLLAEHISNEKPYLNASLTLRLLAEQLDIHPNQLSWLLNENLGKNFNEFINHYRVETFKDLAKKPENANITIMGLAYDSGFNSKTVFNTYFKKEMGITPRQFLKM